MFYHMVQSFPKGAAVDPRQAHEAARRLAEYFDGCEVLVCTHVDREHIHSHCVINSVNFETGKKLHMAKEQLQELMRRNDMICQEMGLPVFDAPTQQARGMSGAEYHTALKGQSWKLRLHEHHRRVHEIRRRQGRFRFSDGIRGLRGVLGEQPQIHHLHHTGRHESAVTANYTKKSIARRPWSMNSEYGQSSSKKIPSSSGNRWRN